MMSGHNQKRPLLQPEFELKYVWQEDDTLEVHLRTSGEVFSFDGVYARVHFDKCVTPNAGELHALFQYGMPKAYMGQDPQQDLRCIVGKGLVLGVINEEAHQHLFLTYPSNCLSLVTASQTPFTTEKYRDCESVFELRTKDPTRQSVALIDGYTNYTTLETIPFTVHVPEWKKDDPVRYDHTVLVGQLDVKFDPIDVCRQASFTLTCGGQGSRFGMSLLEVEKDGVKMSLLVDVVPDNHKRDRARMNGVITHALGVKCLHRASLHIVHLVPITDREPKKVYLNGYLFKEKFKDVYVFDDTTAAGDSTKEF